ncbi:putative motility protein [Chromobacterium sp. IIBBL 290-4]|uniref:putative motility protein n=1 Tax=Chromobacterium sp. IIBBL 290-4 TaxID=2953890 RepID=UPI0020B896BE|nr:putative motility protein [Chromobacterium sp. IIBBL 290-4]UTH73283.1 putative motility protein [Chromobacterium sp. IIBBL 290-4]
MDAVSQVGAQGVSTNLQATVLKKAMQADAASTLTLLQGVDQSSAQIQASNPAHLGQNLDVRA